MEQSILESLLNQLIASWENKVVEFKQPDHLSPTHQIGQYFSTLSNKANLRNVERSNNLCNTLLETQKQRKVNNLPNEMRNKRIIEDIGSRKLPT